MNKIDSICLFIGSRWVYFDPKFLFQQLAGHMPARTQGYPWQLVYSTAVHGSSLKTLYRKMAGLDSPVLLVIKDLHKKVPIFLFSLSLFSPPYLTNKCHRPVTYLQSLNFQVFGAFSSDPFRVSKSCYGTGETFLFSFNPDFKVSLKLIFATIYYCKPAII